MPVYIDVRLLTYQKNYIKKAMNVSKYSSSLQCKLNWEITLLDIKLGVV